MHPEIQRQTAHIRTDLDRFSSLEISSLVRHGYCVGRKACRRSYREHMAQFNEMRLLDVWYATIDAEKMIPTIQDEEARKRAQKMLAKARQRSVWNMIFPSS